jgi:hypothetical protein
MCTLDAALCQPEQTIDLGAYAVVASLDAQQKVSIRLLQGQEAIQRFICSIVGNDLADEEEAEGGVVQFRISKHGRYTLGMTPLP